MSAIQKNFSNEFEKSVLVAEEKCFMCNELMLSQSKRKPFFIDILSNNYNVCITDISGKGMSFNMSMYTKE